MSVYPLEAVQAEDGIGVNRALVLSLRHHSGALTLPDYLTYDCKQRLSTWNWFRDAIIIRDGRL